MEITKANFQELFPDIESSIKESDFLCIDGEFTGLNNGNNIAFYDTPEGYYAKLRCGAMDFLFVQFGLAAFSRGGPNGGYKCKTYNFYVFPKPLNRSAPDCRFVCQSSSLDFLASNGFDFNKLFTNGIPYLTQSGEESLKETMAERRRYHAANNAASTPIPIPQQFKHQVNDACKKIEELLSPDCTNEEIRIEKCSAFVRKLIYQTIHEKFPADKISVETRQGVIVAKKRDKPQPTAEELEREAAEKDNKEVDEAVGFSKVIRAISASEKLVVGHNMLLDLCHMIHQFCDPLPELYSDFKEMVHFIFPKIVDTKFMCSIDPLKELISSSVLENMLQATGEDPFERPDIEVEENYGYKLDSGKYHEAGYDAYVTGVCFISLLKYLQSNGKSATDLSALEPYINKLYLMRTPDTYMDLQAVDPVPCRDHVFHLTFPKTWTSQNLIQLFSAFGSIQISWVNETSAWVALHDKRESANAHKSLCNARLPNGAVARPYDGFTAGANNNNNNAAAAASSSGGSSSGGGKKSPLATSNKRKSHDPSADRATATAASSTKASTLVGYLKRRKTSRNGGCAAGASKPAAGQKRSGNNDNRVNNRSGPGDNCISDLEKGVTRDGMFDVDDVWG